MRQYDGFPKAILFDLDDTISSFDSVCESAWIKCCADFVKNNQSTFTSEELMDEIKKARKWYWADPIRHKIGRENLKEARRDVVRLAMQRMGNLKEENVIQLADSYSKLQDSMIQLLPGSIEALEKCRQKGIRMAVITNGKSAIQREKLKRFGITEFFEEIIIDSEVGFSKPDPQIFHYTLKKMNLEPKDVWMIGDNLIWDVDGANQVGIYSIWNDYKKKGLAEYDKIIPDKIVHSILDMVEML